MRTSSPDLLPIFRSRGLADLLVQLFVVGDDYASASGLSHKTGLSISTVHRELDRLGRAGLVESHRAGNVRMTRANEAAPYFEDLRSLLLKALGPAVVLSEELSGVDQIEQAFVHGSWAARYRGEPGPAPEDIDVIVVGRPSVRDVDEACIRAERRLDREVTPTIVDPDSWRLAESGFIRTVRSRPLVEIDLADDQE
jgi:DNA-binding transcriptional ArsR family regulator